MKCIYKVSTAVLFTLCLVLTGCLCRNPSTTGTVVVAPSDSPTSTNETGQVHNSTFNSETYVWEDWQLRETKK